MYYLKVETSAGTETIFKTTDRMEMIAMEANVKIENPSWDIIVTSDPNVLAKCRHMTKGQILAMWNSLEFQKSNFPETMTQHEIEMHDFLMHNLWYEI